MGKTNGTSEGPMSALSGSLVERSEHRILGDLGVMAVQVFLGSGLEPAHPQETRAPREYSTPLPHTQQPKAPGQKESRTVSFRDSQDHKVLAGFEQAGPDSPTGILRSACQFLFPSDSEYERSMARLASWRFNRFWIDETGLAPSRSCAIRSLLPMDPDLGPWPHHPPRILKSPSSSPA